MARQVLPIVGALVGAAFGAPQLGYAIGSIIGNAIDPQIIKGPKIGEAALQTSAEGVFRPIVFGTAAIKGNVIVRGNRQVRTQRTSQGKGGGPVTEEQRVYWTFAIRIAEGEIEGITRIWQDEKLVYDVLPTSTIQAESAEYAQRFRFYSGTDDQLPDPDLEAFQGVGNAHAYPGTAYVVFPNFDLTDRRESVPDFRFEVASVSVAGSNPTAAARGGYFIGEFDNLSEFADTTLASLGNGRKPITLSGDGTMMVAGFSSGAFLRAYNFSSGWVAATITGTMPSGQVQAVAFSPDGQWLAVGTSAAPFLMLYERVGSTLQFASNAVNPPGSTVRFVKWQDSGSRLAVSFDSNAPVRLYSLDEDTGTLSFLKASHVLAASVSGVNLDVKPDGSRIAYSDSSRLVIFDTAPDPMPALVDEPSLIGGGNIGTYWSDDGQFVYLVNNVAPYLTIYQVLSSSIVQQPNPSQPTSTPEGASLTFDREHLLISTDTEGVMVYQTNGSSSLTLIDSLSNTGQGPIATTEGMAGDVINPGAVELGDIVTALHDRVNVPSFEVSELLDEVAGVCFAGDYSAGDAIRTLMPIYNFDSAEFDDGTGYKIHYPKRGKPVVTTITIDQIIDAPERSVREDSLERPRALHLHYENPTIGYAPAKATIRRSSPDVLVVGERSVQVPVAFIDVDEPAQIADRLMRLAWVTVAGEEEFVVPDNLLSIVPSDAIGVSLRGQTRRMLVTRQMLGAGRINFRLIADRQSAYTSNVTGIPVPPPTPPLPSIVGDTVYSFLDIPALNDNNDRLLWYEAASGQTEAWYGAQTQRKAGSDMEFSNSVRFTQNTIMGTLLDPVTSASEHYTDTTNVVRVQLFTDDVIETLTDEQFLSEGGSFALEKASGGWEVLQYRDSDDEGGGVFALSHLLRGRLVTGPDSYAAGTRFVLLDSVLSVDAVTAWIDTNITTRAVSLGMSPDGATQYINPYEAKSQTEFPVAHLFLERDVDTINASTVPRHRFGTEDNPVQSVNWVGYRWTATDGVNTLTADTNPTASHSFDVTGWSSPVTVTVAQLNRFTGPGPTVSEEIA